MARWITLLSFVFLGVPGLPAQTERGIKTGSVSATISRVLERPSEVFCSCNNIDGRELVFDITIENLEKKPRTAFVFVWVANDEVIPPERALWPPSAVESSLTREGNLAVNHPSAGQRVDLAPGQVVALTSNVLPEPIGWYGGQLVRFKRLRFLVLGTDGQTLSDHWMDLESSPP